MTEPGIEAVTWRDSHFEYDPDGVEVEDYPITTVGWTYPSGRFLKLECEHTPDGPRQVLRIPLECVISRVPLIETSRTVVQISETA